MTDDDATESEDVGDPWLTFWIVSILAAVMATALLSMVAPPQWSLVIAFPIGISAGWLARHAPSIRLFVSHRGLLSAISLAVGVASCAPPAVPRDASWSFDITVGSVWHWRRSLPDGCADWSATKKWASLYVSTDAARCEDGAGVAYLTGEDALNFRNYWPNPGYSGGEPCPHSVSSAQIADLIAAVEQALAHGTTDMERRVLRRVEQRLAAADGSALLTDGDGFCNDLRPEDYEVDASRQREDTWRNGRWPT